MEEDINAKKILGKLLITLRKNKENTLYALVSGVCESFLEKNTFVLCFNAKTYYNDINKQENLQLIDKILSDNFEDLNAEIRLVEKKEELNYLPILKKEFGKMLKVKRKGEKKYV